MRSVAEHNRRPCNLGLVLGRLSQMLITVLGLLIALVMAVPEFTAGQLVNTLACQGG